MPATNMRAEHRRVLVVDDDPDERRRLAALLTAEGYAVCTAASTAEALAAAASFRPEVITLEMDLPSPGGTVFYARLRRSALRETPVVVVSRVGPRPARLARRAPTHQKPVVPAALLETIRTAGAARAPHRHGGHPPATAAVAVHRENTLALQSDHSTLFRTRRT